MYSTYNMYAKLFTNDNFRKYDPSPKDIAQYRVDRELSSIDLTGITYNMLEDYYTVRVPNGKYSYRHVGTYIDIIDAIVAYDIGVSKNKKLKVTPYVKDGERVYKAPYKSTNRLNKHFILKYKDTINYKDIAKMLDIPVNIVHKTVQNHVSSVKDIVTPTIMVWDTREKYDSMLDKLKNTTSISDTYVDDLLGLL